MQENLSLQYREQRRVRGNQHGQSPSSARKGCVHENAHQ